MPPIAKNQKDLFWTKVEVLDKDQCWEWKAAFSRNGYGSFGMRINGKTYHWRAHRLAWVFWNGKDPGHLLVCHTCDNRKCANPHHLFLGTHRDNILDKIAKGRDHNMRKTHCKSGHAFVGENLLITSRGTRECRVCRNVSVKMAQRRIRARKKV